MRGDQFDFTSNFDDDNENVKSISVLHIKGAKDLV
jgi:hypothetical protein